MIAKKVSWLVVSGAVLVILVCVGIRWGQRIKREVKPPWLVGRVEEEVMREEAKVRVKVEVRDINNDGKVDEWTHYKGNVITGEQVFKVESDSNFDGKVDICQEYAEGKLVKRSIDTNLDGRWDVWVYFDEDGRVVKKEIDSDFDGKVDELVER